MSGSNWRVIAATVGWLILSAAVPKGQNANSEQQQSQRSIAESLKGIDATLKKPAEPDVTTQPCERGETRRNSDLCAQWKAADAAESSASAAWLFGLLGSMIGAATLIAAGLAAKFARDAAIHTEKGAVQSQRAADAAEKSHTHAQMIAAAQVRPYIHISRATIKQIDETLWRVRARIQNGGTIPAFDVRVSMTVDYREVPAKREVPKFGEAPLVYQTISPSPAKDGWASIGIYLTADQVKNIRAWSAGIIVSARVEYRPLKHMPVESKIIQKLIVGDDLDNRQCRMPPAWFFGGTDDGGQFRLDL